jgi:hypothetical protein
MLPKPATMAAPPSTAIPVSWKPAVPPPPVIGAAVGYGLLYVGLGDGLAVAVSVGVGVAVSVGVDVAVSVGLAVEVAVAEAVDVAPALVVLVAVAPLAEGGNTVTELVGLPDDVHAESATQANTVARPAVAVSLNRCAVHARAVRAFIEPPHALGNDHFPGRRPQKPEPAGKPFLAMHNRKPGPRRKPAMARPPPEY